MYLIIGLGNPGKVYERTRHNIGFRVIDDLAKSLDLEVSKSQCRALIGQGTYENTKILLAKPQTFMNLSGESVIELKNWYKIEQHRLIVVHDDLDLDTGEIKIRTKGSSGGHNGIESLIKCLGTSEFTRVKIGIGRDNSGGDNAQYVLDKFSKIEIPVIEEVISSASEAVLTVIKDGAEAAMNKYN